MDNELIRQKKEEIIKKYGPWTGHNIALSSEIYTIDNRIVGDEIKLRRISQIIADTAGNPLSDLRLLDLACLEGLFAVEFARRGASVVGIEGREANIAKARFAKEVLALGNLELFQDDVRNFSRNKYGSFDIILCLGILYHLDAPDVFYFVDQIADCCTRAAIFDTHISPRPRRSYQYKGQNYFGCSFREHNPWASLEKKQKALWASLDNNNSFWPTKASLLNLLSNVGFTSVYECHIPAEPGKVGDRLTLLALKGPTDKLLSAPLINELPKQCWPEKMGFRLWPIK